MAGRVAYHGGLVTDGLILHLDAARKPSYPGSGDVWYDLTKENYNATLNNSPSFIRNGEGGISLDGTNDYISTPGDASRSQYSLENSTFTIMFDDSRMDTNMYYLFSLATVFNCLWKRDSETSHYIRVNNVTETALDLGTITEGIIHLTISIGENYLTKFYVNGTLRNTYDYSGYSTDYNWGYDIELGRRRGYELGYYSKFDYYAIMVHNRALTEAEAIQNYNALKGRFGL